MSSASDLFSRGITTLMRDKQATLRKQMALEVSIRLIESRLQGGAPPPNTGDTVESVKEWCEGAALFSHALIDAHLGPLDPPKESSDVPES